MAVVRAADYVERLLELIERRLVVAAAATAVVATNNAAAVRHAYKDGVLREGLLLGRGNGGGIDGCEGSRQVHVVRRHGRLFLRKRSSVPTQNHRMA